MRLSVTAVASLFALVVVQPAYRLAPYDGATSIPRYVLGKNGWICLDRNPRQLYRQDCAPRQQ